MITFVGDTHPKSWFTGEYEQQAITSLFANVLDRCRDRRTLIVNNTFLLAHLLIELDKLVDAGEKFDDIIFVGLIDPTVYPRFTIETYAKRFGAKLHWLGGYEGSELEYNIFAIFILERFRTYSLNSVLPKSFDYTFINYNRKPKEHRKALIDMLDAADLSKFGIVTYGNERTLDHDVQEPDVSCVNDELDIPNDVTSLGRHDIWERHFLNIVSETENPQFEDVFVSEKIYKPLIGMRPFVVNNDTRTYAWLESKGFRTFERYFDFVDLRDQSRVHENIIEVVQHLTHKTQDELNTLYKDMYDDLLYNRKRVAEFGREEKVKMLDAGGWELPYQ